MELYNLRDWLAFFYFYSLVGWCWESCYVSCLKKRWVNRGFMHGPFLPLYGFGAITVIIVGMPFADQPVLLYFISAGAATLLEYVTGVTMEAMFKVRYWDYSNQKFNFRGQICLSSTVVWGFFGVIMCKVVQPPIANVEAMVDTGIVGILVSVISVMWFVDFSMSFRTAIDMRDMLMKVQALREDAARMQKRMDVLVAVLSEEIGQNERVEQAKEELELLKARMSEKSQQVRQKFGMDKFNMLRRNPSAMSVRYKELFEELKNRNKEEVER